MENLLLLLFFDEVHGEVATIVEWVDFLILDEVIDVRMVLDRDGSHVPVVYAIIQVDSLSVGTPLDEVLHIFVVRLLLELQVLGVPHVVVELDGTSCAEFIVGDVRLLLLDHAVPAVFGLGIKSLPRQLAHVKVDEHVPDGFEVVSP